MPHYTVVRKAVFYADAFDDLDVVQRLTIGIMSDADQIGALFCVDDEGVRWTFLGNGRHMEALDERGAHEFTDSTGIDAQFPLRRQGWPAIFEP